MRLRTLDGLRGLAVMGILAMNVAAFAMPFAAYDDPSVYGGTAPADLAAWIANLVLFDGKMRAIFSMLFGASLALIARRVAAAGGHPGRAHLARMGWLLLFGLAHGCLIWSGDILTLYALVGLVAFPLRRLPTERMLVLAAMLFVLQAALLGLEYRATAALAKAAAQPGALPDVRAAWAAIGPPSPAMLATDVALHRGAWLPLVRDMGPRFPTIVQYTLLFDGPETLALMLLGMAGLRSGFLTGGWRRESYVRVTALAYLLGMPATAAIGGWLIAHRFPPVETDLLTGLVTLPLRWLTALGHVALLVPWLAGGGALRDRIAAAGRAAFTNYLGTSLVMTGLFYGWGLGLYGQLPRWSLAAPVATAWLIMLLWSPWWLARFRYGPLEWLWRSLARGRLQPIVNTIES